MTHASRRLLMAVTAVAVIAGACAPAPPSAPSGPSASPSSPSSAAPSAIPSPQPSATVSPSETAAPTPSPSGATVCDVTPQTGTLPSDRFTDMTVSTGATADRLTFVFGNGSLPGPAAPPKGTLAVATPPYTQAASGASIDMTGDHVLQVRFTGMSLSNDVGQETYKGQPEVMPNLPALRHAVMYDASEGIVGWYLGYDGTGCVTLARSGNVVTVTFDHP